MRTIAMHHFLLILILRLLAHHVILTNGCFEIEREALLTFKAGIIDTSNRLSSWSGWDCCNWRGVVCDGNTSHVVKLDLYNKYQSNMYQWYDNSSHYALRGEINPSLLVLNHLTRLNLSGNDFGGITIPKFIGSLKSLTHLDLSNSNFSGKIPEQLVLNHLTYLDLSWNNFGGITIPKFIGSLKSLKHLGLSNSNFSGKIPEQLVFNHLTYLDLSWNDFGGTTIPKFIGSLKSLTHLDLSYSNFSGTIPEQLVLNHLTHLVLSGNNFGGITIPKFIGSLKSLMHLDLSYSNFSGKIPEQLGNLSNLRYLDLSDSSFICIIPPQLSNLSRLQTFYLFDAFASDSPCVDNLLWLSQLSSIRFLDFSYVNLSNATDWLEAVNMLHLLTELWLWDCHLTNIAASLSYVNFTSLKFLSLGSNGPFNTTLPSWLWNLTELSCLDLEDSGFYGKIPDSLGNLTSLNSLYLGFNDFEGITPRSFSNLCNLRSIGLDSLGIGGDITEFVGMYFCPWRNMEDLTLANNKLHGNLSSWLEEMKNLNWLDLGNNSLVGPIPTGIGRLSNLYFLDLSYNSLQGVISEAHFANLSNLGLLILSSNSLIIDVDQKWKPPFQLWEIKLGSCQFLHPQFPAWLRWQKQIGYLNLSDTGIRDIVPEWFWNLPLHSVDLSYNQIRGKLPKSLQFTKLEYLILRSDSLEGPIPSLPNTLFALDLSDNSISGTLTRISKMPQLNYLFLSSNQINSSIPSYMCKLKFLRVLDLAYNSLSGELPRCFQNSSFVIMDLSKNNLTGKIPSSIGSLSLLKSLHLNDNHLYGELPSELQHCKHLFFLDLSGNKFTGKIPTWIGKNLHDLEFLQLRSNMFVGEIPPELAQLAKLHFLDLAHNNLTGPIPHSFGSFSAMTNLTINSNNCLMVFTIFDYINNLLVVIKGAEFKYSTTSYLLKVMDLSENNLSGQIPKEISSLGLLQSLNLSGNHLTGMIPEKLGDMRSLESLDLSLNELQGAIPQSLSVLTYLNHLNFSYNNLSGRIPTGNQLDTLNDPSIYVGNFYLCGPPTEKNCSEDEVMPNIVRDYYNGSESTWPYLSIGLGFVVGFWSVCGILIFKESWSSTYFQMIDRLFDKINMMVAVSMRRLNQKLCR